MATLTKEGYNRIAIFKWNALLNGETGEAIRLPDYADRAVQIEGTLGTGGAVVIEGSIDGTNYAVLTDPQGNALSFTTVNRIEAIMEAVDYIRPRCTGGDGSTSFNVSLICRR